MVKSILPLLAVLAAFAVSLFGNRAYYYEQQLDEPLFIKQFTELQANMDQQIEFSFLENRNGGKHLAWAEIPVPGMDPVRMTQQPIDYSSYQYHVMKKIFIILNKVQVEAIRKSQQPITHIQVVYTDGTEHSREIGRIAVAGNPADTALRPLQGTSSGSSSDHTGFQRFVATEPLKITDFYKGEAGSIGRWINITLLVDKNEPGSFETSKSGSPIEVLNEPIDVPKGASVSIDYSFTFPSKPAGPDALYQYTLLPQLAGVTESGKPFRCSVGGVRYTPYPSEADIKRLIREERGRQ